MKKPKHKRMAIAILFLSICSGGKAWAEPAYISERLYLGLYAVPDSTTEPVKTMASGTPVEIVQRQGEYVQLQLKDGTQGWARAEFVSNDPPAKLRVETLTAERDRLRRQLETVSNNDKQKALEQQLARANRTIAELNEQLKTRQTEEASSAQRQTEYQQTIDALKTQLTNSEQTIAQLQAETTQLKKAGLAVQTAVKSDVLLKVLWLLVAMLASLGMGVYIGIRWLSGRVRRRFNGLKVW